MADDSETNVVGADSDDKREDKPAELDRKISRYINEIELYHRTTSKWRERAKRVRAIYRDERDGSWELTRSGRKYNILWANTQILQPMLYAKNPTPDIQRRFKDDDPVGRVTSDILERAVTYFVDTDHFTATNRQSVLDYILVGRGTLWVRYVPHFRKNDEQITDDQETGESTEAPEIVSFEETLVDYVHADDYGHNIARTWEEVWLVWRVVYMSREELHHRFDKCLGAKIVDTIPLDYAQKDELGRVVENGVKKACIYEAWDKDRKVALWFNKGMPNKEALDICDDPLGLENFFPCPRPLLTTLDNTTLVPVPDYVEYQDQAEELNDVTARVAQIQKAIKVIGAHNAAVQGLQRLFNEGTENETIPIDNWNQFAEKGGIKGNMDILDITPYANALVALYNARKEIKSDLDEITGMSDIVRANTDPNETLGAQRLKSQYSTQRLSDRQREVQRFVREAIRIMVDIMCGHFSIETIKTISGVRLLTEAEKMIYAPPSPPAMGHNGGPPMASVPSAPAAGAPLAPPRPMAPPPLPKGITPDQMQLMLESPSWEDVEQLIRNQPMRSFRIDIETDSTIKADEMQQKADAAEFIKAIGALIDKAMEAPPEMAPFLGQVVSWAARFFSVGKELEGALDSMIQKFEQQAKNPQPKPNPEMIKVQGDLQMQQAKIQSEAQLAQQKAQLDQQTEAAKQQAQAQGDMARAQADAAIAQHKATLDAQLEQQEMQNKMALERERMTMEGQIQIQKAHIMAAASIEVARINAKADDGAAAEQREASQE